MNALLREITALHNGDEQPETLNLFGITRMYHVKSHGDGITTIATWDGGTVTVTAKEADRIKAEMRSRDILI
jgi:hypothetical protein